MFKKILVANRGEIACRVIRACHELDIPVVAVYSEGDKESLHVRLADEAYCIGPAPSNQSYNNIPSIISAAEISGSDAIHPGYGFLAENDKFSDICAEHNITFIGPSGDAIRKMGNKSEARKTMVKHNVPVTPGTKGLIEDLDIALTEAKRIEYPVIIKASAGGGGRGMRIVRTPDEFESNFKLAVREAENAFKDGSVYMEKYIEDPHHIEVQILGDSHGNVIHLGERDCSIQRRHQKVIEESPSPFISDDLRKKMGKAAVMAAKSINYAGAGTIEFLVDKDYDFYFMEMNTRIQVEHCVTEEVARIDLVKEQIRIAAGERLAFTQDDVQLSGHAIEFRINAEDWEKDFMPFPGKVELYLPPGGPGVRWDSHVYPGYTIPPHYDSMIGKLIVWGRDRQEALQRAKRALHEFVIDGVPTLIPFHEEILKNKDFLKGKYSTHFLQKVFFPSLKKKEKELVKQKNG
ncbi:acetyl-CoA carboxylase biotin carboxylase subunit [Candidatus Margulisiibacteriota bacterium]